MSGTVRPSAPRPDGAGTGRHRPEAGCAEQATDDQHRAQAGTVEAPGPQACGQHEPEEEPEQQLAGVQHRKVQRELAVDAQEVEHGHERHRREGDGRRGKAERPIGEDAQVQQRLTGAALRGDERHECRHAERHERPHPQVAPAPGADLLQREDEQEHAGSAQCRTGQVDAGRTPGTGHMGHHQDHQRSQAQRHVDEEDQAPVDRRQPTAEDRAERRHGAGDREELRHRRGTATCRHGDEQQAHGRGEHGRHAGALHRPAGDQHPGCG